MSATGEVKIIGQNPRICVYDSGTDICDLGHKLANYGLCVSQSIGTVNSTDATFQPTYPICTADYYALSANYASVTQREVAVAGTLKTISFGGSVTSDYLISRYIATQSSDWVAVKSLYLGPHYSKVAVTSNSIAGNLYSYQKGAAVSGVQKLLQLDSGYILRGEEVTSDFFVYDVFSIGVVLQPFLLMPKITHAFNMAVSSTISSTHWQMIEPYKSAVNNPSLDDDGDSYDNPTEICVGDLVKPVIENISPSSSSHLNANDGNISFDVVDAIGGVDKSSVYITVSGNLTSQPEGVSIVAAGVSQTGQASFDGYAARYSLMYNPTNDWAQNETVTITVTGTDLVPTSPQTGSEFSCYSGDPNPFGYEWSFQTLAQSDLGASIVAVGDTDAPYLEGITPTPYFGHLSSESDISFYIKDNLAGVDLSSVFIYINDIPVVSYGIPAGSNVALVGDSSSYYFSYSNITGFDYGSRISVHVVASDLYSASPNTLDYYYYFDIIDNSTLLFENFYPDVGITWNPEAVDIMVDIVDRVYDVDDGDLYLSINGTEVSATSSLLYGNRNILATVSGVVDQDNGHLPVDGLFLSGVCVSGTTLSGVSTDGTYVYDGYILDGVGYGTTISGYPSPFNESGPDYLIYADIQSGNVISGTLQTTLVSGVNWDGKATGSLITDVDVCSFYGLAVTATGVVVSGTVGRRLSYHPPNDFYYDGAINVLAHGTNLNSVSPITRESVYQLFHGYNVKVFDREFNNSSRVNVYIEAYNTKEFSNYVAQGFYFDVIDKASSDMTASITGIAPWVDLGASIEPQAPVHKYGKVMEVEIYIEDEDGNALGPYTFNYTIEQVPD